MPRIYFSQFEKESEAEKGISIFEYAQRLGIPINSACGGKSSCHQCTIVVEKGYESLNGITKLEAKLKETKKLKEEDRLACQTIVEEPSTDIYVTVNHYGQCRFLLTRSKKSLI